MGVYIEDMEMPTSCADCPLRCYDRDDQKYCGATGNTIRFEINRPSDCPLISVPPHGRLIDADALIDYCKHFAEVFKNSSLPTDKARRDELLGVIGEIVNAPTIIPAEEGET